MKYVNEEVYDANTGRILGVEFTEPARLCGL